jgi:acyl carrier protein
VLTKDLQLCPVGVAGPLYIAGDGVGRGYVNNAALTAEKFIKDPFSNNDDQSLMYGTGDLVKWLADGNIEFIGRVDEQVKIRGYRIEPGEIESILKQCELVSEAVVLAKEDKQGGYRLVGYIVADGYYDKEGIIAYLKDKLPDYMIPSLIMEVETMPLTANGKVDRRALPDPDASELLTHEYVAPRNDAERALAKIWQEVLGVEQVGIHDDFFELGGHSLLAVRVVYYIERNLLISIPINVIFEFTTISSLIKYLEIELNVNADEVDTTAVKLVKI